MMNWLPFDFERPVWLLLCLLIPVLVLLSYGSLAALDPYRRVLALVVRSVIILLVASCLARISKVQRNEDLTVMFLMDRSHSVETLQGKQDLFIRQSVESIPAEDRVGMIDFARNAYLEQRPESGYFLPPGRLPTLPDIDRTDIAAAIRLSMALFPHDSAKRIVLMSDGNDNMGDVLSEARRARAAGIPIDVVPLWYERRNEIFFDRMIAPTHAEKGEQVPLRMVINSHHNASGRLLIYHNGEPVSLPESATRVNLVAGANTFFVALPVSGEGAHIWDAVFQPDDDSMDGVALNNKARAFSFVEGTSRALVITNDPLHDQPLYDALRREQVRVEMKTVAELGEFTLVQMLSYSTIVLANVPAAAFTENQQKDLASYVKNMGSGLIMTGGDESFGAGGWIGTPIEEIMPVSFEVKHKRVIPRGALVTIMHSCEIPRGNFYSKEMAKKAVDTISSEDYFGVLAYTWSPGGTNWEVPLGLNKNKAAVKAAIDQMQVGDMPDFHSSMQMAYDALATGRGRDAAQKHVIILSDGDATPPSAKLLADFAREKISVSTIAIGWGMHVMEKTMVDIARKTKGKYYKARNPRQLPQIFVKESKVVRRPLIVDDPFQPQFYDLESPLLGMLDRSGADLPPLGGMILTTVKENPNVMMPLIRASDDGDDPVLAHWQYQLGKTVAFTSGFWPIWGGDWTTWDKFAKFWAQVVRWTMRQESGANYDTYTKIENGKGTVVVDALDASSSFMNFLQMNASLIAPDGDSEPLEFTQTGPGRYEASFDATKSGQYLASIKVTEDGEPRGMVRTGATMPFSPEFRDLKPNEALLREIVEISGGRWLDTGPDEAEVFSHDLPPTEARRAAWEWVLAWLLLPLFLLDVAVRRLASWLAFSVAAEIVILVVLLFGMDLIHGSWWGIGGAFLLAELIGWTIRFQYIRPLIEFMTHGVSALSETGERSEAALSRLKGARDRVREDFVEDKADSIRRIAESSETDDPQPHAKRRFDTGEASSTEDVGSLHETLGGPQHGAAPGKKKSGDKKDDASTEDEDVTSRLLRSKRRRKSDDDT